MRYKAGRLAIAMWDSSWIRRRYAGGGFERLDTALDELKERGYNAVRIDAFPHLVAADANGDVAERFLDAPGVSFHKYGFAQWGNPWTVYIHPRRDLIELMKLCQARGIAVALSTWLKPTWERRNEQIEGADDLIRIWDETLQFLDENGCLGSVAYVDVQNEYPLGGCNTWLKNQMDCVAHPSVPGRFNRRQRDVYRAYFSKTLRTLRKRWPTIAFTASAFIPFFFQEADEAALEEVDLLDVHIWAESACGGIFKGTGYEENIIRFGDPNRIYLNPDIIDYTGAGKRIPGDFYFEQVNRSVLEAWEKRKSACEEWLEEQVAHVARIGRERGVPVGNTEGWGSVFWLEHPMLSWDVNKEAGEIGARLGAQYGYAFNCQSNFCEPQFITLWRDVPYHRKVTNIILGGTGSNGSGGAEHGV